MALFVTGIREGQNIDFVRLSRAYMPVPPPDEQEAIGRFIRHLDHRVNRLIKAKRRLIELLNEQKQAIIHRAVTRGLDPTVFLKPSGLLWVPYIPEHWDIVPNGSLMKPKKQLVGASHTDFELLSLTKLGVIVRDLSENKGKFSRDLGTSQEVNPGDIVFCLFDIPETPRTVGLSKYRGMITSAYTVMQPKNIEIAHYIEALYIAFDDQKLLSPMYSGLRNTIAPSRFLSMRMPLPPQDERVAILAIIKSDIDAVNKSLNKLSSEIDLIREYRTRLVADVVTGQLDVRHLDLPEIEESLLEAIDAEAGDEAEETDEQEEEA
jgi:type I restriction enzyme S subunit